jgi:iron(III) transport system substrate-binding protein
MNLALPSLSTQGLRRRQRLLAGFVGAVCAWGASSAAAQSAATQPTLNIYSARHYATDEALYNDFTRQTGIKIQRVDADDAGVLARLASEGASSPADVVLLVDAARLWRAEVDGLFQPVKSEVLTRAIPAALRGKDDGAGPAWFGFSTRGRVIVYDKVKVSAADVQSYAQLADPVNRGRVCTRSGSHPYNLSLFGSLLEQWGEPKTQAWLQGVKDNMARTPKGGDTDQIRAVASGECAVALTNTYYLARLMRSNKPEDRVVMERIAVSFPDQRHGGTHMNVAGGAVARHAKNRDAAVKFLEYLSSASAQQYFADGNNEWPAVAGLSLQNAALNQWPAFKTQQIPVSVMGMNQVKVQRMLDQAKYP